ncbi:MULTISPECIES: prepilin peptidase [Staphylococcus]|mgnify:CR=1 FL=1|uniref:Signal peptidase n=5 Tax=Staphylococcus nepalensis TaxID=214473 RepID=A0A291JKE2_9STAP|nr:hypothetical protein BJD96_06075 [Staphylococcus nepalensis]VDG66877.1 type IV leader peptidase/N-methyltransferase [Lacrimispora indolis]ATH64989.1 hypothetical protein BJG89_06405 [Staphylococcus nepalensis]AWI44355.1 hypothetical protein BJG88_06200 [Staphylococcus nepalensis]PNZ93019.1 signal peptidase [Staphylococcus nepalensis]
MLLLLIVCPILFSFLYHLCFMKKFNLKYLLLRSKCDFCNQQLKFRDMIPVVSYIKLWGRASCCYQKLNKYYLIGEITSLIPAFYLLFSFTSEALTSFLLIYLFLLIFSLYDLQTLSIPLHMYLIFAISSIFIIEGNVYQFLVITFILHLFYICFKSAIGYGDILICALLSYLLPYIYFINVLFLTFLSGSVFAIILVLKLKKRKIKIPLIPFIYIAYCIETALVHLKMHEVNLFY